MAEIAGAIKASVLRRDVIGLILEYVVDDFPTLIMMRTELVRISGDWFDDWLYQRIPRKLDLRELERSRCYKYSYVIHQELRHWPVGRLREAVYRATDVHMLVNPRRGCKIQLRKGWPKYELAQ